MAERTRRLRAKQGGNDQSTERTRKLERHRRDNISIPSSKAVETLKDELHQKYLKECTFKPKINKTYKPKKKRSTGQKRLDELSRSRVETLEKRERKKMERAIAQRKICTFQPRTNRSKTNRAKMHDSAGPAENKTLLSGRFASERLYKEAEKRTAARERAAADRARTSSSGHTFVPQINPESKSILDTENYQPLQDRIGAMQRAKLDRLHRLRMRNAVENPDLTFRPRVDKKTAQIVAVQHNKNASGDHPSLLEERLLSEVEERRRRQAELQRKAASEMREKCSFRPKINSKSKHIVAKVHPEENFLERQKICDEKRREKRKEIVATAPSNVQCTFRPAIGNADAVLLYMRPERMRETANARNERMSVDERIRVEEKRQMLEKKHFEEKCTFRPKINPVSKVLGRASSVSEMVHGSRKSRMRERRALNEANKKFQKQCPFKPKLHKSIEVDSENVFRMGYGSIGTKSEVVSEKIKAREVKRERELERRRQVKIEKEMENCTFRPLIIGKATKKQTGPVVVRGLGRYMELKDLAKRQVEEKRQREKEVFCEPPALIHRTHTVTKPFHFATDAKARESRGKRRGHEQTLKEREMLECTFQPRTVDGNDRRLIRESLLMEESFQILYD
eukprot:g5380.t1